MRIHNTLTGEKEEFRPIKEGEVRIYVCGPTVYDHSHIGHAKTFVFYDSLVRYLKFKGYDVKYVRNITDVDDKMIKKAKEEGITIQELAEKYIDSFTEDMKSLNCILPDVQPRATAHIPEMIEVIQALIDKGYAYVSNGDVYFSVRKFPEYGKLSKQRIEDLEAGARVEPGEKKRDPLDFALWKSSKEGEPSWPSPWGRGRPGWHIECSVMSMKYLGEQIDIHGGATDLIFPHHENEIAQSEAYTGKAPFCRYWVHTGHLRVREEKMSKSLGNVITVKDLLKRGYDPEALRLYLLSAHYRSQMNFSEDGLRSTQETLNRIRETLLKLRSASPSKEDDEELIDEILRIKEKFFEALDDDFNTPRALSEFHEFVKLVNRELPRIGERTKEEMEKFFSVFSKIFGVLEKEYEPSVSDLLDSLIKIRSKLREKKLYEISDWIRERLRQMGIELEDKNGETLVRDLGREKVLREILDELKDKLKRIGEEEILFSSFFD